MELFSSSFLSQIPKPIREKKTSFINKSLKDSPKIITHIVVGMFNRVCHEQPFVCWSYHFYLQYQMWTNTLLFFNHIIGHVIKCNVNVIGQVPRYQLFIKFFHSHVTNNIISTVRLQMAYTHVTLLLGARAMPMFERTFGKGPTLCTPLANVYQALGCMGKEL